MHPATDPSTTPVYGVCPSKMRNLTSTAPQKQACARRGMSKASEQERQLEREAYANQTRLSLGAQLVRRHC